MHAHDGDDVDPVQFRVGDIVRFEDLQNYEHLYTDDEEIELYDRFERKSDINDPFPLIIYNL